MLRPTAREDRDHLAAAFIERGGAFVGLRDLRVRQLDLASEIEPLRRLARQAREQ